jgi:hypothetical protein
MECPRGHGEMVKYESSAFKERYLCKIDTSTGKVVQVAGALAVATALLLAIFGG